MIALLRRNPTFSSSACKSNVSFSISVHFFSTSRVHDMLLHKHKFSPKVASRVASELTRLKNPEKADSILSFLKASSFSTSQLEKIVNYRPRFLLANLEVSIKPKTKIFQDLGFSSDDISAIITSNPAILHLSANNNIIPSLSVLKGLLGSNYRMGRLLRVSAWFVTSNLEKTMVPNFELLKRIGIPMERIFLLLYNYPRTFLLKPEVMRRSIEKAVEMGVNPSSKVFIYAIRTIASMSNEAWELKLQAFRDLGFSESEVLTMFMKAPSSFSGSIVKIKKIKEMLLASGKFSMSCIVNNPMSLAYSIEKRYEPRLRILGILESRNLIKNWPSLANIHTLPDDKFCEKFIGPYLNEIGDVYITKSSVRGKRVMKHQEST